MTIRPVVINGMIQRTQDVSPIKHNENIKPMVDQSNIQVNVMKHEERLSKQVTESEETQQEDFRYDAKEKGNSQYEGGKGKNKREKEAKEEGRVIVKGQSAGFDIKI